MKVKLPGHAKRTRKRLDRAIKACTLINGGMSVADVAKIMKVSRWCIYKWVKLVVAYGHEEI